MELKQKIMEIVGGVVKERRRHLNTVHENLQTGDSPNNVELNKNE